MTGSLLISTLLLFQSAGAETPQPLIDNDRVTVWSPAPALTGRPNDAVVISATTGNTTIVNAYFQPAGSTDAVTGGSIEIGVAAVIAPGQPVNPNITTNNDIDTARSLRVEIKQSGHRDPLPNETDYPDAFPRPGIFRMLDNSVVTVWDYRWTPGEPTPMHFHTKDVVVMFLEDGTLVSTTPDGEQTGNDHTTGEIRFNRADRVHTETLTGESQRAIIIELK